MSAFGVDIDQSQISMIRPGLTKHEALDALVDAVATSDAVLDREALRRAVHAREAVMSTGIGNGIAIPHVRIPEVAYPTVGVGIAPGGVEFNTLDNKPVHIMVLFATPEGANKEYLRLLAQVMATLKNPTFYDRLIACHTPAEVAEALHAD